MTTWPPAPTPTNRIVTVTVRYGDNEYELDCRENDIITLEMQRTGQFYEPDLLEAIAAYGAEGIYIDVGAHIGSHATFFARECPSSAVIAYEPNPNSYELLVRNAERNGFKPEPLAIHDKWKTCKLNDQHANNRGRTFITEGDQVACGRIDDGLTRKMVGCIKMDVEGMEPAVIRSALKTIVRDRPLIVAEANTPKRVAAIAALIEAFGYRRIDEKFGPTPTWIWCP